MIRFIDLRDQDTGYRFAFWDTVRNRFCEFDGEQAWETRADFVGAVYQHTKNVTSTERAAVLERFTNLMPEWTDYEET